MKQYNLVGILITVIISIAGVVNAQKNPYVAIPVKDKDGIMRMHTLSGAKRMVSSVF